MITLSVAASLDGYVAGPGDDLSWLDAAGQGGRDGDYGYAAFYASVELTVMGRGTGGAALPAVALRRQAVRRAHEDDRAHARREREVRDLRPGALASARRVYLCGGGEVVKLFLEHDLVDRVELATIPVLLGGGKPLFPAGFPRTAWRLERCDAHPTGVVQTVYTVQR